MSYYCPRCKLYKLAADWRFSAKRRNAYCIECSRARDRERQQTPKRQAWQAQQRTTAVHKVPAADRAKAWREANPERYKAVRDAWVAKNTALIARYPKKRSAYLALRTPAWADIRIMDALKQCAKQMTQDTGVKYTVDHIIPLRGALVSGLHVPFNLQILTYEANRKKGSFFRVDL